VIPVVELAKPPGWGDNAASGDSGLLVSSMAGIGCYVFVVLAALFILVAYRRRTTDV
jgi:hypothetical protein